ncbi:MAG TPA: hypothetical protein DEP36_10330 [Gammaproteobacteria bacterium]|nr:hypothetical protein [Gammaproteobacteria bacterium]HRF42695.1 hypothetical protein [Candidatus Competibacteraceae bacterium]
MLQINLDKLKVLLGQTLTYQGIPCQVIEVLADELALVLCDQAHRKIIHANQYGDAGDHLPRTFTIPILNPHRNRLNPDLPELARLGLLI